MKRERIEDALMAMGVKPSIKGFRLIVDAVELLDSMDGKLIRITKDLYPPIAEKRGETENKVERAIRHAFALARSCAESFDTVNKYIGFVNCENSSSLIQLHMMLKREEERDKK